MTIPWCIVCIVWPFSAFSFPFVILLLDEHAVPGVDEDGGEVPPDLNVTIQGTLRLYPANLRGKEHFLNNIQVLADNFTAIHPIGDFSLSRNKSLRTLKVLAFHIGVAMLRRSTDTATGPPTYALSTITSPTFSEVTVFYRECDFDATPMHCQQFKGLQMMHKVRGFWLALCVDVWGGGMERYVQMLKIVVAAERENNGFDDIFPEPPVFYSPRKSHHIPSPLEPWVSLQNYTGIEISCFESQSE